MALFGLFGYLLIKLGFEPAPLLLGFVLGKLMEEKLRQALIISRGSFMTFIERPISAGLLLAAILAAVMSTLSCQLLVCSSALTEDVYRTFLRKNASQRELVLVGRIMVLLVSLVAIWIAGNPESKVLGMVAYAWGGFGAAFGPVVILSLFWSRTTRNGALAGILTGAVTVCLKTLAIVSQRYSLIEPFSADVMLRFTTITPFGFK